MKKRFLSKPSLSYGGAHAITYPTPANLNYLFNFGSMCGVVLISQVVSGFLLTVHYIPSIEYAFDSIEYIMRKVKYGWLIRYLHSCGASIFFIVLYCHMGRGIFYRSFRKVVLWYSGVIIYILVMATSFLGYVLPWGQMSYWGAMVITNLFSAIPYIGDYIRDWLWGGFSMGSPTLKKFYSLHFCLPFIILAVSFVHILLLHEKGSTNIVGVIDTVWVPFYPYYFIKDIFGILGFLGFLYCWSVFFNPDYFGHPDNYLKADPLSTPRHISPEWYFLPFYAILRAVPNKVGGVACMFSAILILFILPILAPFEKNLAQHDKIWSFFNLLFLHNVILLGYLGGQNVLQPYTWLSQLATGYYFFHFLIIIPSFNISENIRPVLSPIGVPVRRRLVSWVRTKLKKAY